MPLYAEEGLARAGAQVVAASEEASAAATAAAAVGVVVQVEACFDP